MEVDVAEFVSYSAYILTLLFNSILIYLTAVHTKRISTTYRHMIMGFAALGIGFSTLDIVVRPIMHSYNGCFLYFSLQGLFRSSKEITEVLLDMGIMTLQYAIMMICGVVLYQKITAEFKKATTITANSQIQKQFFKALVYQLTAPSLLVHLPAVPLFFAPFFDMKFSFRTRVVVYFFSIYPLLDSLILFCVVSDYKLATKKIIFNNAVKVLAMLNVASVGPDTATSPANNRESIL
ncbi:Protein CBG09327 [Caenorhabditis briggsae]|uniref:Protein CBG09327 n=1 Tax=Caenorhabditis briggsae TaxID=6238 RepID=A8X9C9_CAEBR|nr:Protein CBG09327 [Caenorhabditis briggsae]CAP29241.2 Protein CBG09327 [Caenorhabditis briggsae]